MTDHPDELRLSAFHDGELLPAVRADVARHVAGCDPCGEYVAGLRHVSAWLAESAAIAGGLSPMQRARLRRRVDAVVEQGLVRFGWELSGLAAAVLLAGSAWLAWSANGGGPTAGAAVPPWVAARTAVAADPGSVAAATPAAAWYGVEADGS